jgi:hypothetical protein
MLLVCWHLDVILITVTVVDKFNVDITFYHLVPRLPGATE